MNKGRIVLDARSLRGAPGGVASYTEALVQHLPELLPEVPIVLLRHPAAARPLSPAPNVVEWGRRGEPNSPWTYFRMGKWLNARLRPNDLFPQLDETKKLLQLYSERSPCLLTGTLRGRTERQHCLFSRYADTST